MPILTADYSTLNHDEMATAIGLKVKHIPILVNSFIDESTPILESLKEAIQDRNYSSIKSYAHAIKGSAGNLRFNEVYEMSKEVEFAGSDAKEDFEYEAYFTAINNAIGTIAPV